MPASTAAASGRPRFRSGLRYVVNDLAIVFCLRVCRRSVLRQLRGRIVGVNSEAIVLAGQDDCLCLSSPRLSSSTLQNVRDALVQFRRYCPYLLTACHISLRLQTFNFGSILKGEGLHDIHFVNQRICLEIRLGERSLGWSALHNTQLAQLRASAGLLPAHFRIKSRVIPHSWLMRGE